MHNIDLILTLAGGLAAALVLGFITHRLGLSPIVGYLLAGVAVGPFTPGFVADRHLAEQLAEVGVILLMFGVGLHFHLEDLLSVRNVSVPGAVVQSLVATALGALVGRWFGWDWSAGIVYGMAISVASTVVLTRVLADNNDLHTPSGHVAIGWLVVEDIFTVLMLVVMPALFGPGEAGPTDVAVALGLALLKVAVLVAFTFLVGGRVIPRVLEYAAKAGSRELFTLTVLVVALGIAVGSAKLFGVSMALGAFLAGMVVGRSEFSLRAASEALPMRDAFAVLFFVSVGMLFDPAFLLRQPWLAAATLAVVLVGKPLAAIAVVLLLKYPMRVALAVAAALAQIGEFSFMLATVGRQLGVVGEAASNALVGASIVSITINPLLYRLVVPADKWWSRRRSAGNARGPASDVLPVGEANPADRLRHRAVVVGYGPVGRTVTRLLRENGIEVSVVEMNLDTVRRLKSEGIRAVYGDASREETLAEAGVAEAGTLLLSSGGMEAAAEVIRAARGLNPRIRVLARTAYLREAAAVSAAGAEAVFSGEGELALAFTEAVLRRLGATPEQIDRERDRVRTELFGDRSEPPRQAPAAAAGVAAPEE